MSNFQNTIRNDFEKNFRQSNPDLCNLLCRIIDNPIKSLISEDAKIITNSTDDQKITYLNIIIDEKAKLTKEEEKERYELFSTAETREILFKLADSKNGEVQEKAASAIAIIADCEKGKKLFSTEESKEVLLKLMGSTNKELQEYTTIAIAVITEGKEGKDLFSTEESIKALRELESSTTKKEVLEDVQEVLRNIGAIAPRTTTNLKSVKTISPSHQPSPTV